MLNFTFIHTHTQSHSPEMLPHRVFLTWPTVKRVKQITWKTIKSCFRNNRIEKIPHWTVYWYSNVDNIFPLVCHILSFFLCCSLSLSPSILPPSTFLAWDVPWIETTFIQSATKIIAAISLPIENTVDNLFSYAELHMRPRPTRRKKHTPEHGIFYGRCYYVKVFAALFSTLQ